MPQKQHELGNLTVWTDDEFRTLPPALTTDELRQLADNVKRDGQFTDPIVCWNDGRDRLLVLDGHNRIDVWENRNGCDLAPPKVCCVELSGRESAINWIIDHALGQRNLSDMQKAYLTGKRYAQEKQQHGGKRAGSGPKTAQNPEKGSSGHNDHLKKTETNRTSERIAEQSGKKERAVRRNAKVAEAIDAIAEINPKAAADIRSEELKVSQKDVVAIAASSDIPTAIKNLRQGKAWDDGPKSPITDAAGNPVPKELEPAFLVQDRFDATLKHLLPKLQEHALLIQDALYGDHRDDRKIPKSGFRAQVILDHLKDVHGMFQAFAKRYVCDCQNSCPKCHGRGWRK